MFSILYHFRSRRSGSKYRLTMPARPVESNQSLSSQANLLSHIAKTSFGQHPRRLHTSVFKKIKSTLGIYRSLLLLGSIFCFGAASQVSAQEFALLTNAVVDSEGIFLAHVLQSDHQTPLPNVRVANAPAFGQAVVLSKEQILQALRTGGSELVSTNWRGADQVRITRRSRALAEAELKEQLTAALQRDFVKDKGELEIRLMRTWATVLIPDENYTVKILDLPNSGVGASCIVRFELLVGRETLGSWQAPLQTKIWREVWVAKSPVKRDQPFADADVAREKRDVLSLRDVLLPAEPEGTLEFAENISPGMPIYLRSLRQRPVVHRGQVVEAYVTEGSLTISLKVEVLENGAPGQSIRVRNPQSRREFRGKVKNEQIILVSI